jgi:hypothetical protein
LPAVNNFKVGEVGNLRCSVANKESLRFSPVLPKKPVAIAAPAKGAIFVAQVIKVTKSGSINKNLLIFF